MLVRRTLATAAIAFLAVPLTAGIASADPSQDAQCFGYGVVAPAAEAGIVDDIASNPATNTGAIVQGYQTRCGRGDVQR